jgi:DNA ligase (NAD+)
MDDIIEIQKLVKYHSDLYYNKEKPIISDSEYDDLFKKLTFLEEKFNIKDKQSLEVGSVVIESTFKKVPHSRPMISLDNTYNEEDLSDFDDRIKRLSNFNLLFSKGVPEE